MEVIDKFIDIESFTSRLPANIPPCDESQYCKFKDELDGDYGMQPKTVRIPDSLVSKITEAGDLTVNVPVPDMSSVYYPLQPKTDAFISFCEERHSTFPENKKYFKCYYIESGKLYEYDLTTGDINRVIFLSFRTMHEWFKFFHFYNETFLGGYGMRTFSSARERWEWVRSTEDKYNFKYSSDDVDEYDALFAARGGVDVMNWIFDDVFGFKKVVLADWKDYYDLVPHYMFYGQVRQWKSWFEDKYPLYKDLEWIQCKDMDDCCECREWFRRGGNDMYDWLQKQTEPNSIDDLCIDGTININVLLTRKCRDLGYYVPLINDFSTKDNYKVGDEVVYNYESYRLKTAATGDTVTAPGIRFCPQYKELIFGNLNPDDFNTDDMVYETLPESDWLWNRIDGEEMEENNGTEITGYTTSKLSTLRDLMVSTDDKGNTLNGFLNRIESDEQEDSDGPTFFIQPEEGTQMDLYYHKGNVYELERDAHQGSDVPDPEDPDIKHGVYWGDIITSIRFYLCDTEGNEMKVKEGKKSLFEGTNTTNLDALRRCENEINFNAGQFIAGFESALEDTSKVLDNKIRFEIQYVIGGLIDHAYCTTEDKTFDCYQELPEDNGFFDYYKYKIGVRYKESGIVKRGVQFFNAEDNTSILLYYYDLLFNNTKIRQSDTFDYTEQIANFSFWKYCNKDNDYDGIVTLRMIRRDKDLNMPVKYRETADINVERGIKSALDVCLKLQEVRSFEALEQYGNGSITMADNQ